MLLPFRVEGYFDMIRYLRLILNGLLNKFILQFRQPCFFFLLVNNEKLVGKAVVPGDYLQACP